MRCTAWSSTTLAVKRRATMVAAAKFTTTPTASGVSVHEALLVSAAKPQDTGVTRVSRFSPFYSCQGFVCGPARLMPHWGIVLTVRVCVSTYPSVCVCMPSSSVEAYGESISQGALIALSCCAACHQVSFCLNQFLEILCALYYLFGEIRPVSGPSCL